MTRLVQAVNKRVLDGLTKVRLSATGGRTDGPMDGKFKQLVMFPLVVFSFLVVVVLRYSGYL